MNSIDQSADKNPLGSPTQGVPSLPPSSSAPVQSSPLEQLMAPQVMSEERFAFLVNERSDDSRAAIRALPRNQLVELLEKAHYFETVLAALGCLKTPQSPAEISVITKLLAVDKTPSLPEKISGVLGLLLGRAEHFAETFPGRVGPRIWSAPDEKSVREGCLTLYGERLAQMSQLTLEPRETSDGSYVKAILAGAAKALRGIPAGQLDLVRLAINLSSEPKGLGADSRLICAILENAFPDQLQVEEYSRVVGRVQLPTKWKRYANKCVREARVSAIEGAGRPMAPDGLDRNEKVKFEQLLDRCFR